MRKTCTATMLLIGLVLIAAVSVSAGEKSSFDLNWYGYFKLDGAYDQNLTSHGNFVMWVPRPAYAKNDDQFNMTANETRFGMTLKGRGYDEVDVGGNIEFDLYANVDPGTIEENSAMLQLRHAYFTIQSGNFKLLAGQTSDLVSPLNPSTLNYTTMWGCGNIGYRRPQISLWYTIEPSDKATVSFAGGFFRTIGTDLTPTFSLSLGEAADGPDDGTDAGIPTGQGRIDVWYSISDNSYLRFGGSGLWGQLKAETNLGNFQKYESWAGSGHVELNYQNQYGFSAEGFTGQNLGSYFGGILQNSTINGLSTQGGWATAWWRPVEKIKVLGGYEKATEVITALKQLKKG